MSCPLLANAPRCQVFKLLFAKMNDEALFVLEVHLDSVSLPDVAAESDAALRVAFQFLDFAPQVLQPAAGTGTDTPGSQWEGKSCMFGRLAI